MLRLRWERNCTRKHRVFCTFSLARATGSTLPAFTSKTARLSILRLKESERPRRSMSSEDQLCSCRRITGSLMVPSSASRKTVLCKVSVREGKAVVDTDKGRRLFGQHFRQPFRDPTSCPILPRTKGRLDFNRRRVPVRYVYTQAFEACHRGFRTGVVHPDIPFECQWHVQAITSDNSVWASP